MSAVAKAGRHSPAIIDAVGCALLGANIRRDLEENEARAILAVRAELSRCVREYTGTVLSDSDPIFDEMTEFLTDRFAHISVSEITPAFRLAAAGSLDCSLSSFYGIFSIGSLGAVFSAYDNYRKGVIAELQAKTAQIPATTGMTEEEKETRRVAAAMARIEYLKTMKAPTTDGVEALDYSRLVEFGFLNLTAKQKAEIWDFALELRKSQLRRSLLESKTAGERRAAQSSLDLLNADKMNDELKASLIALSQRLSVVRWIADQRHELPVGD